MRFYVQYKSTSSQFINVMPVEAPDPHTACQLCLEENPGKREITGITVQDESDKHFTFAKED